MKFTFTNKEEYLAYRSAWKAEYKELTQTIREKKWMRKEYSRAANKAFLQVGSGQNFYEKFYNTIDALLADNERYMVLKKKYENDRTWLEKCRKAAKEMNEELKLAKQEAQRQYLANKQQLVEA